MRAVAAADVRLARRFGDCAPIRGEPAPLSLWALIAGLAGGRSAYRVNAPPGGAMGTGMTPQNTGRIRVFTIVITAPQQVQTMGARSLNRAYPVVTDTHYR